LPYEQALVLIRHPGKDGKGGGNGKDGKDGR
jgi:hypothetical protein